MASDDKRLGVTWALTLVLISVAPAADPSGVRLVDIANRSGLTKATTFGSPEKNSYILETTGTGVAIFDYDGDGDNDIYLANGTRLELGADQAPSPQLYRNDGAGTDGALLFVEVARPAGMAKGGWGQGLCVGDYDNDGDADLAAAYFGHNILWVNQGDGMFRDGTAKARLPIDGTRWGAACAFLDYDNDGDLDLFFSNYVDLDLAATPKPGETPECNWKGVDVMCGPRGLPRASNVLYRNEGDGSFRDVSEAAGIAAPGGRYGLGVLTGDFDNDGLVDIYVACDMTPSLLYRNQGDGSFEEIGSATGVAFNVDGQLQAGMGAAAADYDGNGFLDIVKTNFSGDLPSLYNNEDGNFFDDLAAPAGLGANQYLGWGVLFQDFNEDGRPDILMAHGHVYPEVDSSSIGESYRQPTVLYLNRGDGRFRDASGDSGPALKTPRPSRGMAAGDLDGDGRPEIVIVNVNQPPTLLRNEGPAGRRIWLQLEGRESNRSAVGARVWVETGERRQMQEVRSGGSYFSHSEFALHFGLGEAEKIDELRVLWPSGRRQEFRDVAGGRYRLVEGDELAELDAAMLGAAGHSAETRH